MSGTGDDPQGTKPSNMQSMPQYGMTLLEEQGKPPFSLFIIERSTD
jgi:hypothetical protein